jgi:hypothetical protein
MGYNNQTGQRDEMEGLEMEELEKGPVTRIDGKLRQPHWVAPDQTIRVMGNKFGIVDGQIWFFPTFPMKIFDHIEFFRLYSLIKGWKSPTFRSFPIIFTFQRMEIPNVSKFSDYIHFSKDGNPRRFEVFRLYSLFRGWESPTNKTASKECILNRRS